MGELIPRSSGHLVDDGYSSASIVNDMGVQYKVGKNVVWVWKTCQAKNSVRRIIQNYATTFNMSKEEAKSTVETIIQGLEDICLLERLESISQK